MDNATKQIVEVRCFSFLKRVCDERGWSFPYRHFLTEACSALELARKLNLPLDLIEAVFINGKAMPLAEGQVKPGDRVGFVPPGTPGPYRALLGMVKLDGDDKSK